MITKEKKHKLYDLSINNDQLKTENLYKIGFNKHDLNKLINDKILIRVKRGTYKFIDVDSLYDYSVYNYKIKDFNKALLCLIACNKLDSNNILIMKKLALAYNKLNKEKEFINVIYQIIENENVSQSDKNLYLLMLSNITNVKEEYQGIVDEMKLEDILLSDDNYLENSFRKSIYERDFRSALNKLKEIIYLDGDNEYDNNNKLVKRFLNLIQTNIRNLYVNTSFLAKEKDYERLKYKLNKSTNFVSSSYYYSTIKNLVDDIIEIQNTDTIPPIRHEDNTNDVYYAINCKDYKLALEIQQNSVKIKNHSLDDNALVILLKQINNIMDRKLLIKEIITLLNENKSIEYVKYYLSNKELTEFYFLIMQGIKIGKYKKDNTYFDLVTFMNRLDVFDSLVNYVIYNFRKYLSIDTRLSSLYLGIIIHYSYLIPNVNIRKLKSELINQKNDINIREKTYKKLINSKIKELKIKEIAVIDNLYGKQLKDVVFILNKKNIRYYIINDKDQKKIILLNKVNNQYNQEQTLNEIKKCLNRKDYYKSLNYYKELVFNGIIDENICSSIASIYKNYEMFDKADIYNELKNTIKNKKIIEKLDNKEKEQIKELLYSNMNRLQKDGLIIIDNLKKEQIEYLKELIDKLDNIVSFSIENNKSLVIRTINNCSLDNEQVKKYYTSFIDAVLENKYNEAISYGKSLIKQYNTYPIVYYFLAKMYVAIGNYENALDYIRIAKEYEDKIQAQDIDLEQKKILSLKNKETK